MSDLRQIVRALLLLSVLGLAGCFYFGKDDFEDVVQRWPEDWSTRDCLTIILGATQHNLFNSRSPDIKVIAIPYYPSVIAAIERRAHVLGPLQYQPFTYSHADETYRHRLDTMLATEAGMYVDWSTKQYVDSRGNYLHEPTQIDSLLFYVSIENVSWPSVWADITDLENSICLVNDNDESIKPRYVWGKQRTILMSEERLLMMFVLRKTDHHFLTHSHKMRLRITDFPDPIVLEFPLARMK